jgi:hypothetical protein
MKFNSRHGLHRADARFRRHQVFAAAIVKRVKDNSVDCIKLDENFSKAPGSDCT